MIVDYCEHHGLDWLNTEAVVTVLRAMDEVYLEWQSKQAKKASTK